MGVYGHYNSRDRAPRLVEIERAAEQLREAGHTATVEVDGTVRDNATVRADQHERLENRRAALEAKGQKLSDEAAALRRRSDEMIEHIPMGQTVGPGARGRAHRNLLNRSIDTAIKSAHTDEEARRMPDRIAGSYRQEAHRERLDVTARRVDRLNAELRGDLVGPAGDGLAHAVATARAVAVQAFGRALGVRSGPGRDVQCDGQL
ncbi:DUF3560 domain-containing protein, partial [Streptomyces sp. BE133]|uniref:DUF3560 domain-containing protein n=1 Tax=Streptomyces sp. BE133 TaxID=3002523 RepID=UPI002E766717